ncbi:MAG: MurR/RpiR family transcriptional regulator [Erysipelotrichaceae bacterium]|nr:MurR/RpiR family transcriptional regulator [Erysipelotrichaceae bacterium]
MLQAKIRSMIQRCSKSELKIIEYIRNNPIDPKIMTSSLLGKQLDISQSTIIRFTQKLGYSSFRAFLAEISVSSQTPSEIDVDILSNEDTEITMQRLFSQYTDVLKMTMTEHLPEQLDDAVKLLKEAGRIVFFAVGGSSNMCEYFATHLIRYNMMVNHSYDVHTALYQITQCTEKDVVVIISESGETDEIKMAVNACKQLNVPILGITDPRKNTLGEASTVSLHTVIYSTNERLNVLRLRISQMFVIDLVVLALFKSNLDFYTKHINVSDFNLLRQYNRSRGWHDRTGQ